MTDFLVKKVINQFLEINFTLKPTMVALSGGSDSVALLYCLSKIKNLELFSGHMSHNIRCKKETELDINI